MNKNPYQTPTLESDTIAVLSKQLMDTNSKLAEANEKLEANAKSRQEMLANLSHDLRAPITAIRNTLDIINSSKNISQEEFVSYLQLINRRTETLENLINDIYYLCSLESTPLHLEKIDIITLLDEYYYDILCDKRFEQRILKLNMMADSPIYMNIDIHKFIRVLDNLFINALKFSEDNTDIILNAYMDVVCQTFTIQVQDHGIGIPSNCLTRIFDRSYTVSSSRTPGNKSGSGLGLAIAKTIIEQHNGFIVCESKEGIGSSFIITLPILSYS